jgi:hypothetical protein
MLTYLLDVSINPMGGLPAEYGLELCLRDTFFSNTQAAEEVRPAHHVAGDYLPLLDRLAESTRAPLSPKLLSLVSCYKRRLYIHSQPRMRCSHDLA